MNFEFFFNNLPELTITGLAFGAIYALIALGYTMVYGVLQLINFAHSEVFMYGTFAMLWTVTALGGADARGLELVAILLASLVAAMALSAIIALFLGLRVAQALQWLGPDEGKLSIRLFGMTSGLVLAFFGNRIPKMLERFDPTIDAARRQAFQRMAGWVFVLTGLAAAAIWLVLPVDHAKLWATLAVAAGTLLVAAQVVRCHFRGKNA